MIRGLKAGAPVLIWVCLLVIPMIVCCALGMNYSVMDFIHDDSKPLEDRILCYRYFGTFLHSAFSMYEITFANYAVIGRFLYENVDEKFSMFFLVYKLVMGIAVLRVIYGVFLQVVFTCAQSDDAVLIAQKRRKDERYVQKMLGFLKRQRSATPGFLTRDEFLKIIQDPDSRTWLSGSLELDIHDAELLFDLLDIDGDHNISTDEIVSGCFRLKGSARSLDILALTRLTTEVIHKLDRALPSKRTLISSDKN
jgi:hypothetical protein